MATEFADTWLPLSQCSSLSTLKLFSLCSDSLVLSAKIKQENYKAATVSAR